MEQNPFSETDSHSAS